MTHMYVSSLYIQLENWLLETTSWTFLSGYKFTDSLIYKHVIYVNIIDIAL